MEMLLNFHFVRPWWLLALIPAAMLLTYLWRQQQYNHAWQKVIAPDFLAYLIEGNISKQSRWPFILLALAWILSVLALAGPAWNKLPQPVFKNQSASVVVLDLSASMYATDSAPDRFTVAKHKLLDLLHARGDGLTALVVYAGDAHIVTPLTDDINTIENMVTSITPDIMPIPGSNAPEAISLAINLLKQANESHGNIILISDGIDRDQAETVVNLAKNAGTSISVLGVGTVEGAAIKLPNGALLKDNNGAIVTPTLTRSELQTVAKETHGLYVETQLDDSDINALVASASHANIHEKKASDRFSDTWQEEGAWLVLLILPIAAWCFRRGWLLSVFLVIALSPTQHANASDMFIFKTPDQAGQAAFNQHDYKKAAELFENSEWKGASYYLADDYIKAAETFAKTDTAQSNYNKGNALVKLGEQNEAGNPPKYDDAANAYEDAIKSYNRSLELNASNQKAISNKAVAENLLTEIKKKIEEQKNKSDQQQNQNNDQSKDQNSTDPSQKNDSTNSNDQKNQQQDSDDNESNDKQSNDKQNQQQSQPQNKDDSSSQDENKQSGSQGEQQSQPQSDQQSSQATDKSNKAPDDKNDDKQTPAQKLNNADKPSDDTQQKIASPQEGKKDDTDKSSKMTAEDNQHSAEEKQALEQWLRKVPDDPAGLLERKFRYQSQQNNSSADPNKAW